MRGKGKETVYVSLLKAWPRISKAVKIKARDVG